VIIGGSSDHYHHYDEAWEHREDYWDDRQENYQENASQRRSGTGETIAAPGRGAGEPVAAQKRSKLRQSQAPVSRSVKPWRLIRAAKASKPLAT